MAGEKYHTLKSFIARKADMRLAMHGRLRDLLTDIIVEEWPVGCKPEHLEQVLRAKVCLRVRKSYGSVVGMFLISVMVNALVRIVVEWWFAREAHRVLMVGWSKNAAQNPDV
ncbi:MAG: hypothetical protein EBS56_12665 [Planctomycetia bacterium]|nr:hypothetical protein [Planctomycetia bacterium]